MLRKSGRYLIDSPSVSVEERSQLLALKSLQFEAASFGQEELLQRLKGQFTQFGDALDADLRKRRHELVEIEGTQCNEELVSVAGLFWALFEPG